MADAGASEPVVNGSEASVERAPDGQLRMALRQYADKPAAPAGKVV